MHSTRELPLFPSQTKIYYLLLISIILTSKCYAQNDTIFFDQNWKKSNKQLAFYYRIPSGKIKTKKALGYKIKNLDSLYTITDYYLKSNNLQFKGYSEDKEGEYLIGNAEWYNENNILIESRNFNYKNNNKFEIPKWPILYLSYSIATKSQFTGGLEFCLDCENKNKFFLGLGYGISSYDHNYYGLPDLHLSYNFSKNPLFIKAGVSNQHTYTLAGITAFNAIDLGLGYSIPFETEKARVIKGFTFGITFRITNNKKAYTTMTIM